MEASAAPGPTVTSEVPLAEVVGYLDEFLRIREVPDEPNAVNGLQVENSGRVGSIVAAVDASQATIDGVIATLEPGQASAAAAGPSRAPLGWECPFYRAEVPPGGGAAHRDIPLYSAHIPLDVHPEVGNNAVLAERLGLQVEGWFGNYRGIPMGVWGHAPRSLPTRDALALELDRVLHTLKGSATLIPGGPKNPARIGIITGGAGGMIAAARDAGSRHLYHRRGSAPHLLRCHGVGSQRRLCRPLRYGDAWGAGHGISPGGAVRAGVGFPRPSHRTLSRVTPVLELAGIHKRFGSVQALRGADFVLSGVSSRPCSGKMARASPP